MNLPDHITFWQKQSDEDWDTALLLASGKRNLMALFAIHPSLEKILNAHWIKDNFEITPPRSHDLQYLYKNSDLELSAEDYGYLAIISGWNIEGRYPDYKQKISKMATPEFLQKQLENANRIRLCLQEKLLII